MEFWAMSRPTTFKSGHSCARSKSRPSQENLSVYNTSSVPELLKSSSQILAQVLVVAHGFSRSFNGRCINFITARWNSPGYCTQSSQANNLESLHRSEAHSNTWQIPCRHVWGASNKSKWLRLLIKFIGPLHLNLWHGGGHARPCRQSMCIYIYIWHYMRLSTISHIQGLPKTKLNLVDPSCCEKHLKTKWNLVEEDSLIHWFIGSVVRGFFQVISYRPLISEKNMSFLRNFRPGVGRAGQ